MVEIRESYRAYAAPEWVRRTVDRLLSSIAEQHLNGLGTIVLTDSAAIGRGKTQRVGGRKYERKDCLGFYHARQRGEPAWIELVVDKVVAGLPRPFDRLQLARDVVVSEALFHEIGHYLQATLGSAARSGESGAEDWRRRLARIHFRKRYWYLAALVGLARALLSALRGLGRLRPRTSRFSGRASRAPDRER